MNMTMFWWFLSALGAIFFFLFVLHLYDVGPAIKESFHPAPSPVRHHSPAAPAEKPAHPAVKAPAAAATSHGEDDLRKIEGIGPKIEAALKAAGIHTFEELAAKSPDELRAILDNAGFTRINDPETWPEQAALAAKGEWDKLEAFQSTLKGGRRRIA